MISETISNYEKEKSTEQLGLEKHDDIKNSGKLQFKDCLLTLPKLLTSLGYCRLSSLLENNILNMTIDDSNERKDNCRNYFPIAVLHSFLSRVI